MATKTKTTTITTTGKLMRALNSNFRNIRERFNKIENAARKVSNVDVPLLETKLEAVQGRVTRIEDALHPPGSGSENRLDLLNRVFERAHNKLEEKVERLESLPGGAPTGWMDKVADLNEKVVLLENQSIGQRLDLVERKLAERLPSADWLTKAQEYHERLRVLELFKSEMTSGTWPLAQLRTKLTALDDALIEQIKIVDANFLEVKKSIDANGEQCVAGFETANENFQVFQSRIDEIDGAIGTLQGDLAEVKAAQEAATHDGAEELAQRVARVEDLIARVNSRVDASNRQTDGEAISADSKRLADLSRIERLERQISDANVAIAKLIGSLPLRQQQYTFLQRVRAFFGLKA